MAEFATLQHATYTEAEWTAWDGVLLKGQMAFSSDALYSGTDQMKYKVGNGTDTWTDLDYVPEPSGFTGGSLTSAINEAKGSDIASAATTDIGAATGNFVHVTGTTTITALGTIQAGTRRIVRFAGALTLTHNATSLILPTGANITTAANDVATFVSEGSGNWRCVDYLRADGSSLAGSAKTYQIITGTLVPADSTTYYSNATADTTANFSTNVAVYQCQIPITGTIKECSILVYNNNLPTTEASTLYLRNLTTSTDYQLSNAVTFDAANGVWKPLTLITGLSIPVVAGSNYVLKLVTPAWATNPTLIRIAVNLSISA